jgi:LPXTG-motif cell wall-anchored protein
MRSRVGLKTAGALLTAGATVLLGTAIVLAPSALAAPSLSMSPSTVKAGTTVTLHGSGYPTAGASLFITLCGNPPGATNCDTNLSHVKQFQYAGGGSFTTTYTIAVTKFSTGAGTIDCSKVQCVVGTTNAMNPADQSYNGAAKFTVASAAKPTPTPTPTPSKSSSSPSPSVSPTGPTLPKTGVDSSTPLVAGAASVALLAGIGLLVASGLRRRSRQH